MPDQTDGLLSPFLRRRRIAAVRAHLSGRVLDFGCGTGALAAALPPENYLGVERDAESLRLARSRFPLHRFITPGELDTETYGFDTVAALAVIEHFSKPGDFFRLVRPHLKDGGRLVITTPRPLTEAMHRLGSRLGLFSRAADEEHEDLLNRKSLQKACREEGFEMCHYRRFLLGLNQLAVLRHTT